MPYLSLQADWRTLEPPADGDYKVCSLPHLVTADHLTNFNFFVTLLILSHHHWFADSGRLGLRFRRENGGYSVPSGSRFKPLVVCACFSGLTPRQVACHGECGVLAD